MMLLPTHVHIPIILIEGSDKYAATAASTEAYFFRTIKKLSSDVMYQSRAKDRIGRLTTTDKIFALLAYD